MKAKIVIALATLSWVASSSYAQTLPFHPYRKVGDKYYDLNPLYSWIKSVKQREKQRQEIPVEEVRNRPMKEWFGVVEPSEGVLVRYKVSQVLDDGLLIQERRTTSYGGTIDGDAFFLRNYPGYKNLTDNQDIRFLALRTGSYKYTDTLGATRTVPCYDYGVPYDPWAAQAAAKSRRSTNSPASTNPPISKP